jgi:hypothetical protein
MGLLKYHQFLLESAQFGSFQILQSFVGANGLSGNVIDYGTILNDEKFKQNEGAVLNEINFFEHLLDFLGKDAREVSKEAENLVAILLGGNNSNEYDAADTIFSDVDLKSGERVSVKASKENTFMKVLNSSRIKSNQLLSIIFKDGLSAISDNEKPEMFARLESGDVPKGSGAFSIAACYKSGPDFVMEKSAAVTLDTLVANCRKNIDKIKGDNKGRIAAGTIVELGFKPEITYTIKGISGADIKKIADERKIILKKIEILPTADLRNIAQQFHL